MIDRLRRTDLFETTVHHHRHFIAQEQCLFLIMRHKDGRDGPALEHAAYFGPHRRT